MNRDQEIIKRNREIKRLSIKDKLTQEEISLRVGVTRARVGQILNDMGIMGRQARRTRWIDHDGQVLIYDPDNPHARKNGMALESRVNAGKKLKRKIRLNEIVIHLNGDTTDNRPKNLKVVPKFTRQFSRKQLILLLQWAAITLDKVPMVKDLTEMTGLSIYYLYTKEFTLWSRAQRAAGMKSTKRGSVAIPLTKQFKEKWAGLAHVEVWRDLFLE